MMAKWLSLALWASASLALSVDYRETEFLPASGQAEPGDGPISIMEPTEFASDDIAMREMGKDEEQMADEDRVKKEKQHKEAEEIYKKTLKVQMELEAERNEKMQMQRKQEEARQAILEEKRKDEEARQAVRLIQEQREEQRRRQQAATLMDRDEEIQVASKMQAQEMIRKENEAFVKRRVEHDEALWREHQKLMDLGFKALMDETQRNATRLQKEYEHKLELVKEEERARKAAQAAKEAYRRLDGEAGEHLGHVDDTVPVQQYMAGVMQ